MRRPASSLQRQKLECFNIDQPLVDLLKGAQAFRDGKSEDLPAIQIVDPTTVKFTFEAPSPLAMGLINERPIMPKHLLNCCQIRS